MRKLIVNNIMSLDGYIEGPGGNVMVLPMDSFFDAHNLERLRAADTVLLGATSYMGAKSYWPAIADNPERSPAVVNDPSVADVHRETSQLLNTLPKVVVSDSLTADDTDPWRDTTTIVRRDAATNHIADLKNQPGRDILTFGSHVLWNSMLTAGLVDELHLMVGHAVLGGGTPAFESVTAAELRLVEIERRDGSDNFIVRYEA